MNEILKQLKIKADVVGTEQNGTVMRFFLKLQPGGKVDKIERHATEIALAMKSYGKPIIKPITEKGLISVEFITKIQDTVEFNDLVADLKTSKLELPIIIGKTLFGGNLILDLTKLPHLLIAGSTGSGKSVLLHSVISSLILNEKDIDLVLIDPKTVELTSYKDVKNLISPIIVEPESAVRVISGLVEEMNDRFKLLSKKKVNSIIEYNKKAIKKLPYIVLIIDEFSDLMYSVKKDFQKLLCVLIQKARAAGIFVILATQRPDTNVISGTIKANFPARISFKLPSIYDSRIILNEGGAEKLLNNGDGLIVSPEHNLIRFKGAFISAEEIKSIVEKNKSKWYNRVFGLK